MFLIFLIALVVVHVVSASSNTCRFAPSYSCKDFSSEKRVSEYLDKVMAVEGNGFAQPGVGYDAKSGYSYDGHPLNYNDATLYGEPHLFSAPSKESIHLGVLAKALSGDRHALIFAGGLPAALDTLELKLNGFLKFNATYPGYGCFHPWVDFDLEAGTFNPLDSWSKPYYKVPGLDNGEIFWSVYAVADQLSRLASSRVSSLSASYAAKVRDLAKGYQAFKQCQINNAKTIFYRGEGQVSATVYILDAKIAPQASNYVHCDGYLNDPYEGETLTQLLYLLSPDWESDEEREKLWIAKRGLFTAVNYTVPEHVLPKGSPSIITVQNGWWFSTHEQWKLLLLPYLSSDLPLVHDVFANAERVRTIDAVASQSPGLLASVNDVTNGAQEIPDYVSAAGVGKVAHEPVLRRDVLTPYGSFGLMLFDRPTGLCWYNNMLSGPRMQSRFGSTEAVNVNGTMICPLTTWDSKITTVLAMLGGIGDMVGQALREERDPIASPPSTKVSAYDRFVSVVAREHELVFGPATGFTGTDAPILPPKVKVPSDKLSDWANPCGL